MTRTPTCLALTLALLATPALAAVPYRIAKPAATSAASGDVAANLIRRAREAATKGNKELAIRLAQSAIVAAPAHTAPYDTLAALYATQGDTQFARFYYDEALSIDPTDSRATKALSALKQDDGQRAAKADSPAK